MFARIIYAPAVRIACVVAVVALGGACGSGKKQAAVDAASCDAIGATLIEVMQHNLDGLKDRNRNIMESRIQLIRDEYVKACKRDSWPQAARECHIQAKTLADFTVCGKGLAAAGAQPGAEGMGPASEPIRTEPAPAAPPGDGP